MLENFITDLLSIKTIKGYQGIIVIVILKNIIFEISQMTSELIRPINNSVYLTFNKRILFIFRIPLLFCNQTKKCFCIKVIFEREMFIFVIRISIFINPMPGIIDVYMQFSILN